MPIELEIIRAQEFIRLGAEGHFDLEASRAVLAELARACRKRGINQALLDLRAFQPGPVPIFTPDDLLALVNTFHEIGFTREQRLAVLYSSDPHCRARLFAFIGKLRGWSVQAFENFAEAVTWLAFGGKETKPEATTELTPAAREIPLRRIKALNALPGPAPTDLRRRRPGGELRVPAKAGADPGLDHQRAGGRLALPGARK